MLSINSIKLSVSPSIVSMVAKVAMVLVILAGLGMPAYWPSWLFPVVGAFLGFFAVKDTKAFLLAGLALFAAKYGLSYLPVIGTYTKDIANQLMSLVAPAMFIVSIRSIFYQFKG